MCVCVDTETKTDQSAFLKKVKVQEVVLDRV